MPTETGTAFLVDPMGHKPEALSEREFRQVRNYLDIMRNQEAAELARAISWLFYLAIESKERNPGMGRSAIVGHMVHHFLSEVDNGESGGMLTQTFGQDIEVLSDREFETLKATLVTIRAGGWFPKWLALQCGTIANASGIPADRHPTPLQIAASLVDDIREHEEAIETARQFAQMRPDLILGATIEPLPTQQPPAAERTTQPATRPPAKAQGARKPRKKMASA